MPVHFLDTMLSLSWIFAEQSYVRNLALQTNKLSCFYVLRSAKPAPGSWQGLGTHQSRLVGKRKGRLFFQSGPEKLGPIVDSLGAWIHEF